MEESTVETPTSRKYPLRKRTKVKYEDFESPSDKKQKRNSKNLSKEEEDEEGSESETEEEKENETEYDDESIQEISEYDKLRLKNIEENRKVLMQLGLIDPLKEQKLKEESKIKKVTKPKPKPQKPKEKIEPRKRSMRLLGKTPEGKEKLFLFQDTPTDSPTVDKKERTRIEEEVLSMGEDGETADFLDSLKSSLSQDSAISSMDSVDSLIDDMRKLKFVNYEKVTPSRTQSMCVHPMESKVLIISGSNHGDLGLWDATEGSTAQFSPHVRAVNCISVNADDNSKVFSTSHDGTVRCADLNKSVFDLVYQSDEKRSNCHLTWHSQVDANTLLVAHGTGEVGVVDLRSKSGQRWFHCHPRSVRTAQPQPSQPHYFLTSSGTGESKIWDLRGSKKHEDECVANLSIPKKGLTSAFFSPDGNKVVQTCNDDYLRIYDSSNITDPKLLHRVLHDNHTGQWLSVFKAIFHPTNSDLIIIGSMLQPRRIQMYNSSGVLVREVKDADYLTTVLPVIALHPTQPIMAGGNSSGRVHIFTTTQVQQRLIKEELD